MSPSAKEALEAFRTYEVELSNHLSGTHVSPAGLVDILDHIQQSGKAALLLDLETASANSVEERLWSSHQKIHNHYRSVLTKLRDAKDKKVVELRKLTGHYVKFLKGSQSFYRGYIWGLNQVHGGIPELERCAQAVRPHDHPIADSSKFTIGQVSVLRSCHRSLIQLGDLSRYRENANLDKDCKWGPAIGYYELAESILPASGFPNNQLAVLQLTIGNQFKAIYHLYRSLAAEEPHPQADDNLRRAFGRLRSSWDSGLMLKNDTATSSAGASKLLLLWYLRYLEVSYHARGIAGYDELDKEVNERLKSDLEKGKMDPTLRRVVLINIAAVSQSRKRVVQSDTRSPARSGQSYQMSLRLALTLFITLLTVIENELENVPSDESSTPSGSAANGLSSLVTVKLEDMLPSTRLYSLWLNSDAGNLLQALENESNQTLAKFWTAYARCLTLVSDKFPPSDLATLQSIHGLPEDTDILGFTPLQCTANNWLLHPDGVSTRQSSEPGRGKEGAISENITRIRDILSIAVNLSQNSDVPLALIPAEAKFVYSPLKRTEELPRSAASVEEDMGLEQPGKMDQDQKKTLQQSSLVERSEAVLPRAIHDVEIERMVDDLVGSTNEMEVSRSVDSLPEYNEPTTPPPTTLLGQNRTSLQSNSLNSIGTSTANALLEAAQNYSQKTKKNASSRQARKASHATPQSLSPAVRAQSLQLSPPKVLADPTSNPGPVVHPISSSSENYQSPLAPASPRPNTAQRTSPLEPPFMSRHSRGGSTDSTNNIWSIPGSSWNPSGISNSTNSHSHHLGNGTFGTVFSGIPNSSGAMAQNSSPRLSVGTANNPWMARIGGLPPMPRVSSSTSTTASPWNDNHSEVSRTLGEPFASGAEMVSPNYNYLNGPTSPWAPK